MDGKNIERYESLLKQVSERMYVGKVENIPVINVAEAFGKEKEKKPDLENKKAACIGREIFLQIHAFL